MPDPEELLRQRLAAIEVQMDLTRQQAHRIQQAAAGMADAGGRHGKELGKRIRTRSLGDAPALEDRYLEAARDRTRAGQVEGLSREDAREE